MGPVAEPRRRAGGRRGTAPPDATPQCGVGRRATAERHGRRAANDPAGRWSALPSDGTHGRRATVPRGGRATLERVVVVST
ncbi:hypothetical protein ACTWP5_23610 [Streptomyces sp. 4N509B]|uniref:hypothetical protein n=1 Tax=Streptomyces sp. 4N509B TaxID=3457413 RepID=UPI003FCFC28B